MNLFYEVPLGFANYDMNAQAIKFGFPFVSPLETLSYQKCFRFPTSNEEVQRPVGGYARASFSELAAWGRSLGNEVSIECLILDRAPSLPSSVPIDIRTAESSNLTKGQLKARVIVFLEGSKLILQR
jgi:hypothetical protein